MAVMAIPLAAAGMGPQGIAETHRCGEADGTLRRRSPLILLRLYTPLALVALFLAACFSGTPANLPSADQALPTNATTVPTQMRTPDPTAKPIDQPSGDPTESAAPLPTAAPTAQATPEPTPIPTPVALDPKPRPGKFEMDIGKSKAFVRQATTAMCVPASMQIMINLMSGAAPDRSRETQDSLYTLGAQLLTVDHLGPRRRGSQRLGGRPQSSWLWPVPAHVDWLDG